MENLGLSRLVLTQRRPQCYTGSTMSLTSIAKMFDLPVAELQKEGIKNFLEKKLLETKSELFALANKYGVKSVEEFEKLAKKGKIQESAESRDDFFKLDYLEEREERITKALKSLD